MNFTSLQNNRNPTASIEVKSKVIMDNGPGVYRIGLIAVASDYVVERDFTNMRPNDDTIVYVSRVLNVNPCTVENLKTMGPRLSDAVSVLLPDGDLNVICYCCTSGTTAMGFDLVEENIHKIRPSIPVVTPITAGIRALNLFNAKRISILTPYIDEVNREICKYLQDRGFDIAALTSFQFADDNDMARIAPESIMDAAIEADRSDADALFISCTAIRAVDVVERIESKIGKPVISANQALFWEAVRIAGYKQKIKGFGKLLELEV